MARFRCRPGSAVVVAMRVGCTIVPLALMLMGTVAVARPPLRDAPVVWDAGDTQPIAVPEYFEPKFTEYTVEASLSRPFARLMNPGRWLRGLFSDQSVPDAANVNSLDEVPGGAWFTNRIGLYPLTNAELAAGNGAAGPDTSAPWVVIGAKSGGVATGFRIRDACGDVYLIKFDPPDYPGTTIHAGVVANLIFYACGYHVPEDQVVAFTRDQVIAAPEAQIKDSDGSKVVLDGRRLDAFLAATGVVYDGRYHALASKFLPGKPLGPFDYLGRRQDDPNDTVRHENRRELRGLRMIAAWLNHFDTKAQNSLDMYVGEPGEGYVRHSLIDFASTLGAQAGNYMYKFGYEYSFDPGADLGRLFTLGANIPIWEDLERAPGLPEVGYWDAEHFQPLKWKPAIPNSAFANMTPRDGYWAAKIISAFTDEGLQAIAAAGRYRDPAAAEYIAQVLAERRDLTARYWFDRVAPLDFFAANDSSVVGHDLGVERGYYGAAQTKYRVRVAAVTADRDARSWSDWEPLDSLDLRFDSGPAAAAVRDTAASHPFLALDFQVSRGDGWSSSTIVYLAVTSGRIVALDR